MGQGIQGNRGSDADDGYPRKARLVLDAAVLKDTMVLEYEWPADR